MSIKLTGRSTGIFRLLELLRPLVELGLVFIWVVYLLGLLRTQDYNGDLTFDLFLARWAAPRPAMRLPI